MKYDAPVTFRFGRCRDCKHWVRNSGPYSSPSFGHCGNSDKLAYRPDWSDLSAGLGDEDLGASPKDDMLLYEDYESYAASLTTGQNFGCIHWEARP